MTHLADIARLAVSSPPVGDSRRRSLGLFFGTVLFSIAAASSWLVQRQLAELVNAGERAELSQSAEALEQLLAERRAHLVAVTSVLSDDTRVRAMLLTPDFDEATVVDLLTDLRVAAGASLVAIVDGTGTVRSVVGASELDGLDLSASGLLRSAVERAAARPWVLSDEVVVLAAAPVRLGGQVRAFFLMGEPVDDALLTRAAGPAGAIGGILVGQRLVASSTPEPEVRAALKMAASAPLETFREVPGHYLARAEKLSDSASSPTVAWLVPRQRRAEPLERLRFLAWIPAGAAFLILTLLIALAPTVRGPSRSPGAIGEE